MSSETELVITLGLLFFLGLGADILGRRTMVPRVTFLILVGILIGPGAFDLLPPVFIDTWFPIITTLSLGMIGFLLGEQFSPQSIRSLMHTVMPIALGKVVLAFVLVALVLWLLKLPLPVALILASVATASAPAAVYEVVHELGSNTPFSKTLLSVVALDDILALLLFSVVLALVKSFEASNISSILLISAKELFGSLALGVVLGYPIAKMTGRIREGEPTLVEALGSVFLICGLASLLELSPILSAMAMGSAVKMFAAHHTRPFHAIENIQWLFMILFFILAGASLHLDTLMQISLLGSAYIIMRVIGFYGGAYLGARAVKAPPTLQKYLGLALMPQAGVNIGMALSASQVYSQYADIILPIALGSTVLFELFGPLLTRYAITKANHTHET